ncbi:ATPase [Pseudomonas sp. REP124]|uniref:ATPase n=1 Tax=Pseudomonas sp. REP124 TaxID=2875731 RepID=UPI001CCBB2B8|nr:ATPase [Pseudomonas sp. REP124]MBZ9781547.1 ATPase [Pseudomonas sp. REP124]
MKISTLLAFVAVFSTSVAIAAPAVAADPACHFLPIADSGTSLQKAKTVAVLYSENTLGTQEYLQNYHAVAVNGAKNPEMNQQIAKAFVDSSDPKRAINWLMGSLQKQFASVTVYDSLDAAVQAHPDVVVMLDTYSRLVSKRNNQVDARFMAKFYDANLQYIGQAEGSQSQQMPSVWVKGKAAPQIAAQINQQTELQVNALKQFDASLKVLMTSGTADHVASN